jgi:hypothetical protein
MIGMEMCDEQPIEPRDWNTELAKPNRRPTTRVEQELLISRFDQRARTEAID